MAGGKINQGKLILYSKDILNDDTIKENLLFFTGVMTEDNEDQHFFSGIYDNRKGHENCCLLLADIEIFVSNISKQEFISMVKKYCESRKIPIDENGNVTSGGFPLFENIPEGPAPSVIRDKNRKDIEIHPVMLSDFFPIMYNKENTGGKERVLRFGKFINDNEIRIYEREDLNLLGIKSLIAA